MIDSAPPPSSGGTAKLYAVLLAVVLLAIIGASVGYVLREWHIVQRSTAGEPTVAPGDTGAGAGVAPPAQAPPSGSAGREKCPDETERDAKHMYQSAGGLKLVLYVETDGSEVWICRDRSDGVFYQGRRKSEREQNGGPREPLVDKVNSILLNSVEQRAGGVYVATNDQDGGITTYEVSKSKLVIRRSTGTETESVTRRYAP